MNFKFFLLPVSISWPQSWLLSLQLRLMIGPEAKSGSQREKFLYFCHLLPRGFLAPAWKLAISCKSNHLDR